MVIQNQLTHIRATIWSDITISERADREGQVSLEDWVTPDRTLDIYGKTPSDPENNIPFGAIVLLYVSGRVKKQIVGAGRVAYRSRNNVPIYNKPEHNEYRVVLEDVTFFNEPLTSETDYMTVGGWRLINCVSRGAFVVNKVCTPGSNQTHLDNFGNVVQRVMMNHPGFVALVNHPDFVALTA